MATDVRQRSDILGRHDSESSNATPTTGPLRTSSRGYLPPIRSLDSDQMNSSNCNPRSSSITEPDVSPKTRPRPSPAFPTSNSHADPPSYHAVSSAAHALTTLGKRASSGERIYTTSAHSQPARYSLPSLSEALRMDEPGSKPTGLDRVPSMPHFHSQHSELSSSSIPTSHPTPQTSELSSARSDSNTSWATVRTTHIGHIRSASPLGKLGRSHRGSSSSSQYLSHINEDPQASYIHQSPPHRTSVHRSSRDEMEPYRQDVTSEPRQNSMSGSTVRERTTSAWQPYNQPQATTESKKVEHVKRALGDFDLAQSLTDINAASKRLQEFSEFYRNRAYQTTQSGPLPGSTPLMDEIEEMMGHQSAVQAALDSLRRVVATQQAALAERAQAAKPNSLGVEDGHGYQEDSKDGGYGGSDPKRRRGRVAPPGRCHSCNRAETPEWRRGPDGARTLCNACGLHYAKLTRKMGSSKSGLANSNLRPKSMTTSSAVK